MLKLGAFFAFSLAISLSASFVFATEKDLFFSVEPGTPGKIETLDDSSGEWSTHRMLHLPGRALRLNCGCLKMSYKTSESLPLIVTLSPSLLQGSQSFSLVVRRSGDQA